MATSSSTFFPWSTVDHQGFARCSTLMAVVLSGNPFFPDGGGLLVEEADGRYFPQPVAQATVGS